MKPITKAQRQLLDQTFETVQATILCRQNPHTGLFPASTDVNGHGDYTDAWVRDNVYSIQAVYGLWLGYCRSGHHYEREVYLGDSIIRLMRGLLRAMMRQVHKVERFKYTQNPLDALHAKYDTDTGEVVVGDDKWGHLQLDATSLYLLMLAQMTQSGLTLVESTDEVNFVQNLVWYIGRGYRTPDYGIWERGNKINNGRVEVNASSVGMVKAALEAMSGLPLLGKEAGQRGVIHVVQDEIARCRTTLENLLPRESLSKEVDAACLSVIGYPAFAVEKADLVTRTRQRILDKLSGPWGCKRFLRDGHQTALEDPHRLHYEAEELRNFEHIESEWPLFYAFLYLDALFADDQSLAQAYREKLDSLKVEKDGQWLLPELYRVPADRIEQEKASPGSQPRESNENLPLVWTQSLFELAVLLDAGLIERDDLDPLGRHKALGQLNNSPVLVGVLAESERVKHGLQLQGIHGGTEADLEPVRVLQPLELARVFNVIGQNRSLGLTGRPQRRPRSLATAQLYHLNGESCVFLPQFQNRETFFLASDNRLLSEKFRAELKYISRHWNQAGLPVLMLYVTEAMMHAEGFDAVLDLLDALSQGECEGIQINTGPLLSLLDQAGEERIDDLNDYYLPDTTRLNARERKEWLWFDPAQCRPVAASMMDWLQPSPTLDSRVAALRHSRNLYEQVSILADLAATEGLEFQPGIAPRVSVKILLEEIYQKASRLNYWSVVRQAASVLGKYWGGLDESVAEILATQKVIAVGRAYSEQGLITEPLTNKEIVALIESGIGRDGREAILNQEILVILSVLMRGEPRLFKGLKTLRPGHLAMLIIGQLAQELDQEPDQAFESMAALSPHAIQMRIESILRSYDHEVARLFSTEGLHLGAPLESITVDLAPADGEEVSQEPVQNWMQWREQQGVMARVPDDFYRNLWHLLEHCRGLVIGDRFDSRNRLESSLVLSSMTADEAQFAYLIEQILNQIRSPSYRQLTLEALFALMAFAEANPALKVDDVVIVEVMISHAVRLNWIAANPGKEQAYNQYRADAWKLFYCSAPSLVKARVLESMAYLAQLSAVGAPAESRG